jgi:hypothetical protein
MNWKSFLSFERMITPVIIKILFWIGLVGSAIAGVAVFFSGLIGGVSNSSFAAVIGGLIGGPLVIFLGALSARIYAELLILAFRINETLTDIKILLDKKE